MKKDRSVGLNFMGLCGIHLPSIYQWRLEEPMSSSFPLSWLGITCQMSYPFLRALSCRRAKPICTSGDSGYLYRISAELKPGSVLPLQNCSRRDREWRYLGSKQVSVAGSEHGGSLPLGSCQPLQTGLLGHSLGLPLPLQGCLNCAMAPLVTFPLCTRVIL